MPPGRPRKVFSKDDPGYRPDRHGDPAQAVTASGTPTPTRELDEHGKALWDRVVPGLIKRRVVGDADSDALTEMCCIYSLYRRLAKDIDDKLGTGGGYVNLTPWGTAFDKFAKLASAFGLTPSDRAKLRAEPPAGGVDSRKR